MRMLATLRIRVGPDASGAIAASVITVSEMWCMSTSTPRSAPSRSTRVDVSPRVTMAPACSRIAVNA